MSETIVHVRPTGGGRYEVFVGTASGEPTGKIYPGTKTQCEGLAGTFSRRDGIPIQVATR